LFWGERKKKSSYGIKAEIKAEDHLKRRFKTTATNRTLKRSPASHGPADWEVIDTTGKLVALIQVKSSKTKGGARIGPGERKKLIKTAKEYHTRAFLTTYERGHYHTKQLYPIRKK
jgi:Holliday junction resolvase-like predicted endonuclease